MFTAIFTKIDRQADLSKEDAINLLTIQNGSEDYYRLLGAANRFSRKQFGGKGTVFAQIGLDSNPCSVNCKFCSLAKDICLPSGNCEKPLDDVLAYAKQLIDAGTEELFLMTTADYSHEKFLQYAAAVKKLLPAGMRFVANVGDFGPEFAQRLKAVGFTGVYHICRLREGVDTEARPETRIHTLDCIRDAGLELYYCVEPIGAEHENSEIAEEIFRAKNYPVGVMAVMKRVSVPGSKLYSRGEISAATLAKVAAVTVLCVKPPRAMGVHEPDELCLMAGTNQIYAEVGVNPRDTGGSTELKRGFSVADAENMLQKAEWSIQKNK